MTRNWNDYQRDQNPNGRADLSTAVFIAVGIGCLIVLWFAR